MESKFLMAGLLFVSLTNAQNWSQCSKTCGGGRMTRKVCYWGGSICSEVFRPCNTRPCVSGWGVWQPCSKTCGGGTQYKMDPCPDNSFDKCPYTYQDCNTIACPPRSTCPQGYRFRYNDSSSCCKIQSETCGEDSASGRRVIGGINATQGQWPWVAAIVNRTSHVIHCGGSLIHKRYVVTAAHCFEFENPKEFYVLLGSVTIKSPAQGHQRFEIEKGTPHKDYQFPKNDIYLVKLHKDAVFTDDIKPICLPSGQIMQQDETCIVMGWGRKSAEIKVRGCSDGSIGSSQRCVLYLAKWFDRKSFSDRLRQVPLRLLPYDACVQGYKNIPDNIWTRMDKKSHLCIGQLSGGKDSCNGDSGGPVACQRCSSCGWYLAGTLSFGAVQCGAMATPGVYMNTHYYEPWIREHVPLDMGTYHVCWH